MQKRNLSKLYTFAVAALLALACALQTPMATGTDVFFRLKESLEALRSQERDIQRRQDVIQQQIDKLEKEKAALDEYLRQIGRTKRDVETAMDTASH